MTTIAQYLVITPGTIYQVLPEWDSYLGDVERNLIDQAKWDAQSFKEYQRNPVPFYADILGDFGQNIPSGIPGTQLGRFIEIVVRNYHHNWTTEWCPQLAQEAENA